LLAAQNAQQEVMLMLTRMKECLVMLFPEPPPTSGHVSASFTTKSIQVHVIEDVQAWKKAGMGPGAGTGVGATSSAQLRGAVSSRATVAQFPQSVIKDIQEVGVTGSVDGLTSIVDLHLSNLNVNYFARSGEARRKVSIAYDGIYVSTFDKKGVSHRLMSLTVSRSLLFTTKSEKETKGPEKEETKQARAEPRNSESLLEAALQIEYDHVASLSDISSTSAEDTALRVNVRSLQAFYNPLLVPMVDGTDRLTRILTF
jgi:hypothetical protein